MKAPLAAALVLVFLAGPARADVDPAELSAVQRMASDLSRAIAEIPASKRLASDEYLLAGPLARLRDQAPFTEVLRVPSAQQKRGSARDSVDADREAMRDFWYDDADRPNALITRLRPILPAARFDSLKDEMERVQDYDLTRAIGLYQRRLDRFEAKYGPGSPKLNLLEAGLNLFFQDKGLLRSSPEGPSPYEILAGYSTSYFTMVDHRTHPLSVAEVGLRHYRLEWKASEAGVWNDLLRPRYWSMGLGVAAENAGALHWPLDLHADRSYGPFLNWGDLKVAYFFGDQHRVAISRQLQLVPGLF